MMKLLMYHKAEMKFLPMRVTNIHLQRKRYVYFLKSFTQLLEVIVSLFVHVQHVVLDQSDHSEYFTGEQRDDEIDQTMRSKNQTSPAEISSSNQNINAVKMTHLFVVVSLLEDLRSCFLWPH